MRMPGLIRGQHYEAAVLIKDAAKDKAERIFIRELRSAGLAEKPVRESGHEASHSNGKSPGPCAPKPRCPSDGSPADSTLGQPRMSATKCDDIFNIQVLTPFLTPQWATVSASRKPGPATSQCSVRTGIWVRSSVPGRVPKRPRLPSSTRHDAKSRSIVAALIAPSRCRTTSATSPFSFS